MYEFLIPLINLINFSISLLGVDVSVHENRSTAIVTTIFNLSTQYGSKVTGGALLHIPEHSVQLALVPLEDMDVFVGQAEIGIVLRVIAVPEAQVVPRHEYARVLGLVLAE